MTQNVDERSRERPELRDVSALYLDSQPLSNGSGFQRTAAVEAMLELAHKLHVEVYVPEAAKIELESQFERKLVSALSDAATACNRVARLVDERYESPNLDVAGAIRRHKAEIDSFLREYRIAVVPFTTRPYAELFRMAAMRQRPFRETSNTVTDAGFKDAIIYMSVVDPVGMHGRPATFLSRDTDYVGAERLLDGRTPLFRATVDEAIHELRRRANARDLEEADKRRRLADESLRNDVAQLELISDFARRNFVVPDLMDVPFGLTRQIVDRQVLTVEVRNLVPLMQDVAPGEQVRMTVKRARAPSPRPTFRHSARSDRNGHRGWRSRFERAASLRYRRCHRGDC